MIGNLADCERGDTATFRDQAGALLGDLRNVCPIGNLGLAFLLHAV